MMQIVDWFHDLFTVENLAYFVLGGLVTCAYQLVKARLTDRTVIIKWQYFVIPLAMGIALNISLQTQQNADCVREFNQVLRVRSEVTSENDRISIEQRELIYDWIHNLVVPPPEIARLPGRGPRRGKWAINLTLDPAR